MRKAVSFFSGEIVYIRSHSCERNKLLVGTVDRSAPDGIKERTFTLFGHWLYCRQRLLSDKIGDTGLYRCEESRENTCVVDVLAVGTACGTRRKKPAAGKPQDWVAHVGTEYRVGDALLCPQDHPWGIRRINIAQDPSSYADFLIDECVPTAVVEEGGSHA